MRELKRLVGLRAYVGYHFGRCQGGGDWELWSVASEDADAAGRADSEVDFEAAEGDEEEHALVSVQEDEVEETAIVEGSAKEQASQGLQFSLHRFFKGPAGQHDPRGDEPVLVRGGFRPDQRKSAIWAAPFVEEQVASKKRQVEMQAMVQAVVEAKQKSIALYGEDGSRAGFFGGRPKRSKEDLRGSFNGVDKSNRIMAGQTRRRIDMDPWEGLEMCEFMEGQVGRYATEDSYWRAMVCRHRPKTKQTLQGILDRKEVFKAKIKERNLAKGTKMRKRVCSGSSGGMLRSEPEVGRGCRAPGGGRNDPYQEQKQQLKDWAIKEKHCLQVFINSLGWKLGRLEEGSVEAKKVELRRLGVIKRIQAIEASPPYLKKTKKMLVQACGLRLLKPQRLVNLSPAEEHIRCELTWQLMDQAIWRITFGTEDDLKHLVLRPKEVIKNRHSCVIIFLDQVPFRAKIAGGRQLYFRSERPLKVDKQAVQEAGEEAINQGQTQMRGQETEDGEKYRITVELRQLILHYFDKDKDPVGIPGPTCLIVGGAHCRLSNISLDGRWIKSEKFWYDKKEQVHVAGQSARTHASVAGPSQATPGMV
jgi:hypothetical protein